MLREALQCMGRADLIGNGKKHLVPSWQPAGTGRQGGEGNRTGRKHGTQSFFTTHAGQGRRPVSTSKTGRVRARHVPST